jgi:hypothetical protein
MSAFMIDLSDWPPDFKIVALLIPFVVMFAGMAIHVHIAASRHYEVMCVALQRSQCLYEELRKGGSVTLKFRCMTVSAMTGALIWPTLSIRMGALDPEDYRAFPAYLKKRMKTALYCMVIGMCWIAFIVLFVKFKRTEAAFG